MCCTTHSLQVLLVEFCAGPRWQPALHRGMSTDDSVEYFPRVASLRGREKLLDVDVASAGFQFQELIARIILILFL